MAEPRYPMKEGRGMCWCCGKPLTVFSRGPKKDQLIFIEIKVDGATVRAHKRCAKSHSERQSVDRATARARTDDKGAPYDDVNHRWIKTAGTEHSDA